MRRWPIRCSEPPRRCWRGWTRSSARLPWRPGARCACWPPQLIDSKARLVREAAKLAGVRLAGGEGREGAADAAAEIEWAKVTQVRPDSYPRAAVTAGRTPAAGAEAMGEVYAAYERLRR